MSLSLNPTEMLTFNRSEVVGFFSQIYFSFLLERKGNKGQASCIDDYYCFVYLGGTLRGFDAAI